MRNNAEEESKTFEKKNLSKTSMFIAMEWVTRKGGTETRCVLGKKRYVSGDFMKKAANIK